MLTTLFITGAIMIILYYILAFLCIDMFEVLYNWYLARQILSYAIAINIAAILFFTTDVVGIVFVVIYTIRWIIESLFQAFNRKREDGYWEEMDEEDSDDENEEDNVQVSCSFSLTREQLEDILKNGTCEKNDKGEDIFKMEIFFDSDDEE